MGQRGTLNALYRVVKRERMHSSSPVFSVKIPKFIHNALKEASREYRFSESQLIRMSIVYLLSYLGYIKVDQIDEYPEYSEATPISQLLKSLGYKSPIIKILRGKRDGLFYIHLRDNTVLELDLHNKKLSKNYPYKKEQELDIQDIDFENYLVR